MERQGGYRSAEALLLVRAQARPRCVMPCLAPGTVAPGARQGIL